MKKLRSVVWMIAFILLFLNSCNSQNEKSIRQLVDRPTAAAGTFYPGDSAVLRSTLAKLFSQAKPRSVDHVVAIICPHAGYDFSGVIAATSFNQIPVNQQYDNIFIIGSSHHVSFMGASIYNIGDYQTPLGKVKVNIELANKLIRENPVFSYQPEADKGEHSIEVEVPFLQYHLKKSFSLVPIVLGTQSEQSCKKIAEALKPYMNENNLFVISTDFSHYPAFADAVKNDKKTCDAILSNSPENLLKTIKENERSDIPNLVTSICGWTSVLTMLDITSTDKNIVLTPLQYKNSGDSKYPDKSRVVGYWSIAVSKKEQASSTGSEFIFSPNDKKELLKIARNTIVQYIAQKMKPVINSSGFSETLRMHAGVFVTLTKGKDLRGCIGQFTSEKPLYLLVQEMAIASATEDKRFEPVTSQEIDHLQIEISVLSPLKKISSPDEIILGKHGIYIKKGYSSGTFLPQVATGTGWNKEEFLGHCARDKAGIGWDGWKTAELYIYEATVFSEKEFSGSKDQ
jgi:MEMO1 family protein